MNRYKISLIICLLIFAVYLFPIHAAADGARYPMVVLESYTTEEDIHTGMDFTLEFTMKNESWESAASNLMLSYTTSGNAFYPSYGTSNQHYIAQISAGDTYTGSFQISCNPYLDSGVYNIYFSYRYQNEDNENINMEAVISIYVSSEGAPAINDVSAPSECVVNKRSFMSVKCENPGNEEIRNVRIIIEGNILDEEKEIVIDNMKPQSVNFTDVNITFQETGKQSLDVTIAYEDHDGNISRSQTYSITTEVSGQIAATPDVQQTAPPASRVTRSGFISEIMSGGPVTLIALAVAVVILAAVIVVVIIKKRG